MIILDTNIVTVLLEPSHPDLGIVEKWMSGSPDQDVRVTVVTRAEILYGIEILPEGVKRRGLAEQAESYFSEFAGRLLPFGQTEADAYAEIMAYSRSKGRSLGALDGQIAAIAKAAGATLATRDADFEHALVPTVNPYLV
ncbi:MAG: PIN domain-containing protein [Propionibacteriaceae bacterium]|jgi:predicted nucleic acid-binding protein|nr:PIN domain-containing protein [Propionibacteriaceae bacterium]